MYVTWQTLLLGFIAICGGFSTICIAGGWLIKIIHRLRKPGDDINLQLKKDNKRLTELEDQYKYISSAIGVLMRCDLVILAHLRTNNNTGQMAGMEKEIQDFLIQRK